MIVRDETKLKRKSSPCIEYADGKKIADQLLAEVEAIGGHQKALGLSAPQIDVLKRVFIAYGSTGEAGVKGWNVYINPTILEWGEERMFYKEGCLSFPGIDVRTNRPKQITVSYLGEDGETHKTVLTDEDAIVFQHELDHCDGILMFDRIAKSVPQEANIGKDKIGRNEKCPCGSGVKYKRCCGK